MDRDPAALRRAILTAPQKADALEVRLDALRRADQAVLSALFEGAPRPVIATCRRVEEGGSFSGREERRREILWAAVKSGASYVDVEHGSAAAESLCALAKGNPAIGVILSHHDRRGMPRDPVRLYRGMARVPGVKAIKIVGLARDPADVLQVRQALAKVRNLSPPLICFCMGPAGVASRILALEWGSWATYASPARGRETATGQVSLPELIGVYRIEEIDDETRFAGIIGTPLGHTLSPVVHNAAYHADGLNFRYLPFEVPRPSGLKQIRKLASVLKIRGLSVTAPYKMAVMRQLDRVEPLARKVGASNTLLFEGRRMIGFNTDASGGMAALEGALAGMKLSPAALTVAVVGAGGAARALAHALSDRGAKVIVASRSERPGRVLARAARGRFVPLRQLARASYDVLINATPVGMAGTAGGRSGLPVPPAAVKGRLVYDMIYRPEATGLLRLARQRGIATLGGLEMLVRQAAEQYELFTGRNAPLDHMREAARQALGSPASR